MPTSFMQSPQLFFTSESVTEGHPDKLCDQISDAILDAFLAQDPRSRVACETAATTGLVLVMGEVTSEATYVEIQEIVRKTIRDIGYTGIGSGFDADTCGVIVSLHGQSPDIAMGVDQARESKLGQMSEAEVESVGAGDQGMMIGFACNETPEYMPLTISLAHKLSRELAVARKSGALP
jgi:S-adenosylmethionine synthetase